MKKRFTNNVLRVAAALILLILSPAAKGQFTNGNLVVLQAGVGATVLTNAATPIVLKEYNKTTANQTVPVKTVYIDSTGPARLTLSGTGTSEGQMTLSTDSSRLVIAGYDAAVGTTGITSSSVAVPRAIDTLSNYAIPGRADTTQTGLSGGNMRCAVRNSLENYWAAGSTIGMHYMGNLATPDTIYNATPNLRVIQAANGKLYFSTASVLSRIGRINTQPTSGFVTADTMITLGTGTTPSPYGFVVNNAENIVYVADDRTAANGGGIQKWTLSGSTWTLAYTFGTGGTNGARSVIADWSGTYPVLYAITAISTGTLIKITDSNATAAITTLAAAPTNTAFRSVAFAPRPCAAPALSFVTTPVTCSSNGSVTLTTTGGTGPFTYAYSGPGTFAATTQNISNLAAGTYTLTVTANGGCTSTGTATVANNATISASSSATGSTTRCQKDSVTLTANSGAGYRYQWKLNGSSLTNDTLQMYKAGASGNYTVTVSSGINCTATSAAISVTINPLPSATITAGGATAICTGGSVQLCVPSVTGNTYLWRRNAAVISGATANCYTATIAGTYKAVVTTSLGCTDSTTNGTVVTIGAPPSATIKPAGTINLCQGDQVVLRTNSSPGLTYTWKRNGVALTGAGNTDSTIKLSAAGIYKVVVSAGVGCADSSADDTLIVNPKPLTVITRISRDTICAGDTIRIDAYAGPGYKYQWRGDPISWIKTDSNFVAVTPANLTGAYIYTFYVITTSGTACTDTSLRYNTYVNPLPTPVIVNNGGVLSTGAASAYQWFLNGAAIPGATGVSHTATANGQYSVMATNASGCKGMSAEITVSGVSVSNVLALSGIRLYPNPVQNLLHVDAPFNVYVTIKDAQGRTVCSVKNTKQVSMAHLSAGVYTATVYTEAGVWLGTQMLTKVAE